MERKMQITVTLTKRDVQEAVAAWLNAQPPFEGYFRPEDVHVGATMIWSGNGVTETQTPVAEISAKSGSR